MKNLMKKGLLLLCMILTAGILHAQENNDSKYLKGAVPEVEGKVVFSKEYSIPGMSQDEIFDRMLKWMETRLKENGNDSRVLYHNREKGQIVGTGDDWIVFSSTALSLDRTRIIYQLTVVCQPEKCSYCNIVNSGLHCTVKGVESPAVVSFKGVFGMNFLIHLVVVCFLKNLEGSYPGFVESFHVRYAHRGGVDINPAYFPDTVPYFFFYRIILFYAREKK